MLEGLPKKSQTGVWAPVKVLFLSSFLPLLLGFRLLVSGTTLHGLLMRVPAGFGSSEEEITSGQGLEAEEQAQFENWLQNNPEIQKRDVADRMALFRDAQKAGEVES